MKPGRSTGLTLISGCFRSNCFDSGLSDPTEVLGRVHVSIVNASIVNAAAFGARPFPDVQGLAFAYVPAIAAPLRRWKPSVYLHQGFAIPLALVLKLTGELTPRRIADRFRQRAILHWSSTRYAALLALPIVARTIRSVLLLAGERLLLFAQAARRRR